MRGLIVLLGIALSAPVQAAGTAPAKPKLAKKKVATKTAKTKHVAKRGKRGRQLAKKRKGKPGPRVKTGAKPLVAVSEVQSDGRVKYGPDRLPPGFAWPPTKAMEEGSRACEAELDALGVTWKPAAVEGMVADPITVPSMVIGGIAYTSAFGRKTAPPMDCHFVKALVAIGADLHALGVREVQFGSIVRNTLARSHGQTKDFWSRHALGIAMDIRSFVDASGRVATVETDYLKDDPLLHGIEDLINNRTEFRQVLTPGNDPISHDDHFHIEASVDFTRFR